MSAARKTVEAATSPSTERTTVRVEGSWRSEATDHRSRTWARDGVSL
jgi:hypothetical protein